MNKRNVENLKRNNILHSVKQSFVSISIAFLFFSCVNSKALKKEVTVVNTLNYPRSFETVSLDLSSLGFLNSKNEYIIYDSETNTKIVNQQVDSDGDGQLDALIFQPIIAANSKKNFIVTTSERPTKFETRCYSRFVPERTDDYAWENNRVAFRTYGPTAQKMKEAGIKGGTLSSGIDAWLKRVDYLIIDNWYNKELRTDASYHQDTGEGLDNFHVGNSRGIGGIAKKVDSTYYYSKNFTFWKTLNNGPLRTSFLLKYADWDAQGIQISEEKIISLDYGSNLSKFEVSIIGTDIISAGITLHQNVGKATINQKQGWISYWEPIDDSEIGMGMIVPQAAMKDSEIFITKKKDESNLYAHIKTSKNKAIYYAGFGWKKSGQFENIKEWEDYLSRFSECLKYPLQVKIE